MTRFLLDALAQAKGPLGSQLLLAAVVAAVLPVALWLDGLALCGGLLARGIVLSRTEARCPRGHAVELLAGWKCPCGMTVEGHAFAACPHCGEPAHAVWCPCGLPVVNPLRRRR